jgi:hypothetical protein
MSATSGDIASCMAERARASALPADPCRRRADALREEALREEALENLRRDFATPFLR